MTSTIDHPHVRLVQSYLAVVGQGDVTTAAALFAPDVRYHVPGHNRLAGDGLGPDAVMGYFGALSRLSAGTYAVTETVDWLVGGDRVLLVAREHVEVAGRRLDWTRLILFRVADGKMAEIWLFEDDQAALDAVIGGDGATTGTESFSGPPAMFGALDDPKVKAVMDYQAAMARGDLDAARPVFDRAVSYRVPGHGPLGGAYDGPDAVMGYLWRLMEVTGGSYAISRMDWLASDDRVGLATRNHAERGGRWLSWDEVILFRFEDGRKREIDLFSGDQDAVDALLANR